ncbi:MOSC domain-containing protein [Bacillus sp. FJAT-27251]|uniref:MOSC domain-containing protein n=1 Tax=Bacillus sp. FJAT-27251 TaxID=1684142 RepID=UPI0006A7CF5A|nr:MOSC domain-containing protein [Bacillus sp. FJAT-27251]
MEAVIVQLNVGMPKEQNWRERRDISAIGKIPIEEAMLWKDGFAGDGIADTKHHGGPDRAVCLYPFDHYSRWEKEYGTKLNLPAFGENITVAGITERDLYIGDVFQLGDAVVEITQGRVPCSTISRHNRIDTLLNRVFETCLTGCFFRVLEEGIVRKTSVLKLVSRVQQDYSVYRANQLMLHGQENRAAIAELVQLDALADEWKRQFSKRLQGNRKLR